MKKLHLLCIMNYLERNLNVFIEEHDQLVHANLEIARGKLVRNVEAKRTELLALNADSMEERQGQKQRPEVGVLGEQNIFS